MKASPAVDIRKVSFSYNGQSVLQDVDLTLEAGDFTALIGPNGGGKTTLLKLMIGLLTPNSGDIRILGEPPRRIAHRLGYMPQEIGINRHFPISVLDVVLMGRLDPARRWGGYSSTDRAAAQKALEAVNMWEFRRRRIGELSGGQRQRVFIARALVAEPDILFLDEPTASVDAVHQENLFDLLKVLNETVTIIIVNHDLMVISSYVKSVACVNRRLHYHGGNEITEDMIRMYQCPVELIAHGIPHRVLRTHGSKPCGKRCNSSS
ncbi:MULTISPECIES: metal ABC transporter ATP-binding protein [Desulfococcus]|jgi:zinc transport system ATP-binding protein|uniref:ABC transporter related protein n=1 Tax=Desulfococcus multivorans DSM 2059 TaxID=1121405 RepID=S7U680_DESML|nr:ABC transporter ATP-binding protein [Desulfococcus multivorans]AOY58883.1 zinc ABC transporter, ATPase subunit [Desulfococcus multivorans]AQV01162.1 ABC transporter [Desulfococcus multivorans]EPR44832.1 ABC transporter related protein [Desulfococcus multivorans DSM 2059]MDX9817973.1 ABC transporter ATP-binding protein [Desulfococcus multivorans]SJZ52491.1 zinc transport system ATP-binding protein [Desulfococcus multivorans DSM 2059]